MIQGFIDLFISSDWMVLLALALSLICLSVEMFTHSFSLAGVVGLILGALGLWLGISDSWNYSGEMLWIIVDLLIIFLVVLLPLKLIALKIKSKKTKIDYLLIDGNKIPADKMGNPDFSFLIGRTGECITDLKPSGKIKIDGKIYNVLSEKGYLYNGHFVKVVKTVSASIYVEKIKSNK